MYTRSGLIVSTPKILTPCSAGRHAAEAVQEGRRARGPIVVIGAEQKHVSPLELDAAIHEGLLDLRGGDPVTLVTVRTHVDAHSWPAEGIQRHSPIAAAPGERS
jgi:hypothetical protein